MSVDKVLENHTGRYFQFHVVTMDGQVKGMEESVELVRNIDKSGLSIDGSSVGVSDVNQSDLVIFPDWDTTATYVAGGESITRALCTFRQKGKDKDQTRHPGCIRSLMQSLVERTRTEFGCHPHMFGELEWYFFVKNPNQAPTTTTACCGTPCASARVTYPEPRATTWGGVAVPHDDAGYCDLPPKDKAQGIRHEIADALEKAGCKVKRIHHENGPGQNEVELKLMPAMKNADDLVTAVTIISAIADQHGLTADFNPKPLASEAGNGYHQHFALYDRQTGRNIFGATWMNGQKPDTLLTPEGFQFVAGLLAHAEEITAVFARNDQTFLRLIPGHEAPCYACWGTSNRTALVRIPGPSSAQDVRIEYRGGDASGATHLMCAVMLAAGLDGMAKKLECPPEVRENADNFTPEELQSRGIRTLPRSVAECREVLTKSTWLRETLGDVIMEFLINGPKKH